MKASLLRFPLFSSRGMKKMKASAKILRKENLKSSESTDVIIVGAGVVGSALAYSLGKDGRCIHVIERNLSEPNRIVGELLHPGGYIALIKLGLQDCVDGIDAQTVHGCVVYLDGKETRCSYPLECFSLDVTGRSFHNGRFVQKMRKKAESLTSVRLEQGTVTSLLEENHTVKGVQYKTRAGQELTASAPLTIVSDGCFSNLRSFLCDPKIETPSSCVGLVLENCVLPHANYGHFILNYSPILFYQISSNEIRCLVDIPGSRSPSISNGKMADYLKNVVAPQMPTELYKAFICAVDKGSIRTMPNRSMPVSPYRTPGAFLIGDALNMRHPLTGGGMTVALSDVVVLRDLLRPLHDLSDAAAVCQYLETFYIHRKPMASTMNTIADTLYTILSAAQDPLKKEMKRTCVDFLGVGGAFSNGGMAIVAGLNPRPWSLVFHFISMAAYSVGRLLLPFPSPKRMWVGAKMALGALGIILPLIKAEGIRQMFFPITVPAYYRTPPVHR